MVNRVCWQFLLVICSVFCWQISSQTQAEIRSIPEVIVDEQNTQLPENKLIEIAQNITVKILSGRSWGSGILIQRQGQVYTIVTNRHVLTPADSYSLQTPDGQIYSAVVADNRRFAGYDLALLQFRSNANYPVAVLGNVASLAVGDEVLATGFPIEGDLPSRTPFFVGNKGFMVMKGEVFLLLEQALKEGYQIGYTNDIRKGMSGGALLNIRGEVIGINGMHAYPLWGDPYVYFDGSQPSSQLREQMIPLSWGIPVERVTQRLGQSILQQPNSAVNLNLTN
ncbi:MAG: serine protease [Oscillatoria sp. PMC 1068.18]|nr:serine protease [Oscillatoria sp. PMC 1076.18]MEC4987999.1 serine protease [Oscillatoria sp. PMC 1068.18]